MNLLLEYWSLKQSPKKATLLTQVDHRSATFQLLSFPGRCPFSLSPPTFPPAESVVNVCFQLPLIFSGAARGVPRLRLCRIERDRVGTETGRF